MKSKIYPNITFKTNQNLCFIGSQLTQAQSLEILRPNDANIRKYTKAAQKLFSEISILEEMLWICRLPSTPIVRIYFSQFSVIVEPYQYPTANCCQQPLYIEIQSDLSGHFACSACLKTIAKFVYSEGEIGSDQSLFFQKQRQSKIRKENLRELFTSQKFRAKKLKNNFNDQAKSCESGSFIMEISAFVPQSKVMDKPVAEIGERLAELRSIINDIFA